MREQGFYCRGEEMLRLWVTGYRSYEMGTFGDKDPKIVVIKYALKRVLREQIDNGLEWIITGGQLGIEQWTVEVVIELKAEFPSLKVAIMLPFQAFGSQWQANSQAKLKELLAKSDFAESVSNAPYQGPHQLQSYQKFMLTHTDGALLVYDTTFEGKTVYDYRVIQKQQAIMPYPLTLIDMDRLQEYATEYEEIQAEKHNFYE